MTNDYEELRQEILAILSFHNVSDGVAESVSDLFELYQAFPEEEAEAVKPVLEMAERTDDLIFNGPAEFEMQVFVVNDETGQSGRATIGLGVFEYPTKEQVKQRIAEFEANELESLDGFRLMTKEESWQMVMFEKTGTTFAIAGGKDWDEI